MPPIVILLFVVVVGIIIAFSVFHSKQVHQSWTDAARALGMAYQGGGFLRSRRITGTFEGMPVLVDTFTQSAGKSSTTYTRFRITLSPPLRLGLRLSREGFLKGLTKLFGAQDIRVGDAAFDANVMIKGSDPDRVRAFLTPARRVRIDRFLGSYPGATIDDTEIAWHTRGLLSDPNRIVSIVRQIARLAWHLVDSRAADDAMGTAMIAMDEGHPQEALSALQRRRTEPAASEFAGPSAEEQLLEGQLLMLGGRTDEAKQTFAKAQEAAPDDPEISDWAQKTTDVATPAETAPAGDQAHAEPAPPLGRTDTLLDAPSVCAALFGEGITSFTANRTFDEQYASKAVRWSGVLESVESSAFDFVFNLRDICKARVVVGQMDSSAYGDTQVFAVIQVKDPTAEALEPRVGQTVTFEGTLLKVDGFMRNLYVIDGRVVG